MNYWNYFNANPGVEPAGMLILDGVHLLESPLKDMYTVTIRKGDPLWRQILQVIVRRCPYYSLTDDLLNGVEPMRPPEMLAFPDSADLADEVRDLLDAGLQDGGDAWWAWMRIRRRLEVCCWLVSNRGLTFTPYIPPAQTLRHFEQPSRRLYLSATVGSVDDLQRRLGAPALVKLSASVQPRQGERLVVIRDSTDQLGPTEVVDELRPFLENHPKALWLCARHETAKALEFALVVSGLPGEVRRLEADNGADEPFAAAPTGHLVAAGRYDGMDFPGDTCRVEVVPEVPVATSDLEAFVSAYLRDAPFAEARFGQRVAQALGRCNRSEDDRAVYLMTDPEFLGRFSQKRSLDALPGEVRDDVYAALDRSDYGFAAGLEEASRFLAGEDLDTSQAPPVGGKRGGGGDSTGDDEVQGMLALWREDYERAASLFDRVAGALGKATEHKAFWLAMRALTLRLAADFGDEAAGIEARAALRAAAATGSSSTFFTRLRLAETRLAGRAVGRQSEHQAEVFTAWDSLIDRLGAQGPRLHRWTERLLADLRSDTHDVMAEAVARVGTELLGLPAAARQATSGEEDAYWDIPSPRRVLAFEVKLAPTSQRVVNDDVEQAEGAARALQSSRGLATRGLLITPHSAIDQTAQARLQQVRPIQREVFIDQIVRLLGVLKEYRRGWSSDSSSRVDRRDAVQGGLPPVDWLWSAIEHCPCWVEPSALEQAWRGAGFR
jgi:RAD3-like DEAD/DEAH box helicase